MKVLVFWYTANPPSTSIVKKTDIKYTNDSILAKWKNKWCEAKIIAENNDEEWLASLNVSTEGNIMKSIDTSSAMVEMQRQATEQKKIIQLKKKAAESANNLMVTEKSVFDETEDEDTCSEEIEAEEGSPAEEVADERDIGSEHSFENSDLPMIEKSQATKIKDHKENENQLKNENVKSGYATCHFCDTFSEDASFEEKFIHIAESAIRHLQNLVGEHKTCPLSSDEMILTSGYDIKINRYKLKDILRFSKGDRRAITRLILHELIDEEELSKLSASTIPPNIFAAVERYVNFLRLRSKVLTLIEFKRCITNYCGSLKIKLQNKSKASQSSSSHNTKDKLSSEIPPSKTSTSSSKDGEKNDIRDDLDEQLNLEENKIISKPKILSIEKLPKIVRMRKPDEYAEIDEVKKFPLQTVDSFCKNFDKKEDEFSKLTRKSELVELDTVKRERESDEKERREKRKSRKKRNRSRSSSSGEKSRRGHKKHKKNKKNRKEKT